jgi:DNA-binding YbaB/EbfC family protein
MNIAKMMQQAKAMQEKMQAMQEKMEGLTVEGVSGGSLVKVVTTCKGVCVSISIDPSLMKPEEKEILEDLIKAALNDAKGKADQKVAEDTQKMMADMGLPPGALGGGGLPF